VRRRGQVANFGTFLFISAVLVVNYLVFLRDPKPDSTPPLEQKISPTAPGAQAPAAPAAVPSLQNLPFPLSPFFSPWIEAPAEDREPQRPMLDDEDGEGAVLAGALEKGRTLLQSAARLGVDTSAMYPVVAEMEKVFDFKLARSGDRFRIFIDGSGQIAKFFYETSPLDRYIVERNGDTFTAMKQAVQIAAKPAEFGCVIRSSLYSSIKRCGEDPQLASKIVDLFAWDVDFFQDVRDGDRFKLIVEKQFVNNQLVGYGRVLAAEYDGAAGKHRVVWYDNADAGIDGYYRADGQAVRKEFLKTPLKYTKMASNYSHHRYNPVLSTYKKHLGVDYSAPEGSPVWAVASGTVTFVGEKGANGNLVTIRHANGYTSYYAHLRGFADGLRVGDQVNQKEVIGFVGATGRAGASHLHFALKHKDRFVDPQKIKFTADNPIPPDVLPEFIDSVRERSRALDAIAVQDERDRS
jgi:murein DD-endopeptidase MepM/ murein hydrolase activator NlpD